MRLLLRAPCFFLGFLLAVSALLASGCGAKTGLRVPDAGVPRDASRPDARDAAVDMTADAADAATPPIPCVEIPFDAGVVQVDLALQTRLERADVFFLIDTTASMGEEIERVRGILRDVIAPAIEAQIPDTQLGVGTFADFPVEPFGEPDSSDGRGDRPFLLRQPMTTDLGAVQSALDGIRLDNGQDEPEAQVEALYQTATGEGLGSYVTPSFGCPRGGFGYPCFRDDSVAIVLLFTDAEFHNGPFFEFPYGGRVAPRPHAYQQAVDALIAREIRVIGFRSGDNALAPLIRLARDTEALARNGTPLVFDIGRRGEGLDARVVEAFQDFAEGVILDVDARAFDADRSDGVDATRFVQAIVPLRATPMTGIDRIDLSTNTFTRVRSGTQVVFELRLVNGAVAPGPQPQRFLLDIVFRGDQRTPLGRRRVALTVPGSNGLGCPPGSPRP